MSFDDFEPGGIAEPLRWQGHYVYIRSVERIGFVSASHQNGHPADATITVVIIEEGQANWGDSGIEVKYAMPEAKADLIPDVRCVITEEPI